MFIRRHAWTLILLLGLLLGAKLIVRWKRPGGSMTLLDAPTMDMNMPMPGRP